MQNSSITPDFTDPKSIKQVESYLKEEKKKYEEYQSEPKLLILGSSDSGKSTLLKQLKILHGGGFNEKELASAKKNIRSSILLAIRNIFSFANAIDQKKLVEVLAGYFSKLSGV
jgi:hypothetical protein